mmetsp:Transcript_18259/g.69113  ORF Transcript_18259/g.69113 Transcript_18259/m.69113 type:complete len:240 (-) Transcript_18259:712-1431(-)
MQTRAARTAAATESHPAACHASPVQRPADQCLASSASAREAAWAAARGSGPAAPMAHMMQSAHADGGTHAERSTAACSTARGSCPAWQVGAGGNARAVAARLCHRWRVRMDAAATVQCMGDRGTRGRTPTGLLVWSCRRAPASAGSPAAQAQATAALRSASGDGFSPRAVCALEAARTPAPSVDAAWPRGLPARFFSAACADLTTRAAASKDHTAASTSSSCLDSLRALHDGALVKGGR